MIEFTCYSQSSLHLEKTPFYTGFEWIHLTQVFFTCVTEWRFHSFLSSFAAAEGCLGGLAWCYRFPVRLGPLQLLRRCAGGGAGRRCLLWRLASRAAPPSSPSSRHRGRAQFARASLHLPLSHVSVARRGCECAGCARRENGLRGGAFGPGHAAAVRRGLLWARPLPLRVLCSAARFRSPHAAPAELWRSLRLLPPPLSALRAEKRWRRFHRRRSVGCTALLNTGGPVVRSGAVLRRHGTCCAAEEHPQAANEPLSCSAGGGGRGAPSGRCSEGCMSAQGRLERGGADRCGAPHGPDMGRRPSPRRQASVRGMWRELGWAVCWRGAGFALPSESRLYWWLIEVSAIYQSFAWLRFECEYVNRFCFACKMKPQLRCNYCRASEHCVLDNGRLITFDIDTTNRFFVVLQGMENITILYIQYYYR